MLTLALVVTACLGGCMLARPSLARASSSQVTIIEDDPPLLSDPFLPLVPPARRSTAGS